MAMTQSLVNNRKSFVLQIVPVMLCFFVMGFVDLVGTGFELRSKRPRAQRLAGKLVPLAGIFLVPDFLGAHRHVDE